MRIRIPKGKWSSGWEVVIFPIWKITLHHFGKMSKLLNLGNETSPLKWTYYLKSFIVSEKDQLPFRSHSICVRSERLYQHRWKSWACSIGQVAVDKTGSPSNVCCSQNSSLVEVRQWSWQGLHLNRTVRSALRLFIQFVRFCLICNFFFF